MYTTLLMNLFFRIEPIGKEEALNHPAPQPKPATLTGVKPFSQYLVWMSAYTDVGQGPRNGHPSLDRQVKEVSPCGTHISHILRFPVFPILRNLNI